MAEVAAQLHEVQAAERSQLAVRLHDSVTQTVLAATWEFQNLEKSPRTERVENLLSTALEELRACLVDLSEPSAGDLLDLLKPELDALRRGGVTAYTERFTSPPTALAVPILRIAREALRNVARHAYASNLWISSDAADETYKLEVEDDGVGFEELTIERSVRDGHVGISSSRVVAQAAGGTYEIQHRSPNGTRVVVDLPHYMFSYKEQPGSSES
jgi:two-component system NarL family sensor kinase